MAIEQYRGEIDRLLADAGIDYRVLQDGVGAQYAWQKLEQWSRANPNDPRAQAFAKDKSKFAEALEGAVKGLRNPNDMFFKDNEEMFRDTLFGKPGETGPLAGAPQTAAAEPVDPGEVERANLTKWITEFTQRMGRQVDMNDPVFASLSNMGSARASMGVGQSGIRVGRGGLGELAIQQGANAAVTPYLQDRIRMEQQGLGMLQQGAISNEQLRQGKYGLNLQQAQMQNNIDQQMYGQQADAAGGVGGTVGGILGGLAGVGLAAASGGALAPAIPGLIAGGSKIGAGAGMGTVQRPTFRAPRPYGGGGGRGSYT